MPNATESKRDEKFKQIIAELSKEARVRLLVYAVRLHARKKKQKPSPLRKRVLSEEEVRRIRKLLQNTDLSARRIARMFLVSKHCILNIKHNKTWKWVV